MQTRERGVREFSPEDRKRMRREMLDTPAPTTVMPGQLPPEDADERRRRREALHELTRLSEDTPGGYV